MTIEEKLLSIWTASATAIALVPASRFKVSGGWQNMDRPYIIQKPIAGDQTFIHNNNAATGGLRDWQFYQISIFADSYSTGRVVAEKVRTTFSGNIDGVQFFARLPRHVGRDDAVGLEEFAVDLRIVETLA